MKMFDLPFSDQKIWTLTSKISAWGLLIVIFLLKIVGLPVPYP
jgi:hypothetical protein